MFKVGDIVIALDTSGYGTKPADYKKGWSYKVIGCGVGRINTLCLKTGSVHGWSVTKFVLNPYAKKSHLPDFL